MKSKRENGSSPSLYSLDERFYHHPAPADRILRSDNQKRGIYTGKCLFHHDTGAYEGAALIPGSVSGCDRHLPAFVLSAGFGAAPPRHWGRQLHGIRLHPSDVDEFPAPHPRVADASGEKLASSMAFFPFSICQISPSSIHRGRSFWVWYTTSCLS